MKELGIKSFSGILLIALATFGCGSKKKSDDTTPTTTDPTVDTTTMPATPAATDLTTNSATQAQVASSALDSATSTAAAGTAASGSTGAALVDDPSHLLTNVTQPTESVTKGGRVQTCYLGTTIAARATTPATGTLSWPESASAPFSASKNDPTTATNMYVESALLQYPAASPTATLTLSAPFAFANLAEVIETDSRVSNIQLADKAQTSVNQTANYEEHRFWVAKNQRTGRKVAAIPVICAGAGKVEHAAINWGDDKAGGRVDGLNLLARFTRTGSSAKTYFPKVIGVLATTTSSVNSNFTVTGAHLVQWSIPAAATTADVTGATIVVQKTVTRAASRTDEILDTDGTTVKSTVTATDEIRATAPLVIKEYRDATELPLAHEIVSGTINKTSAKWFATFAYANVKFDYANSTEVCIPVSGTMTMTVFDKEGGTQTGQTVITYSNATSTIVTGKVDPSIAVSGDDADGTKAQWMMLTVNRRCDLLDLKR